MKTSTLGDEIEDVKIDDHFKKCSGEFKQLTLDETTQITITVHLKNAYNNY